jgi:heterodisulfide reductase subunit A-like polyferredoxin
MRTPGTWNGCWRCAVILVPRFKTFDAHEKPEYGYGRYPNVIISLEFERLLSATGPCAGHVRHPSDGSDPKRIAWIQCVGSRDASCGKEYWSYVCCMYATKQAIIAQEHDNEVKPTGFYIDIRAQGKGFDRHYERAKETNGVRFIRSMVSRVTEDPQTRNPEITYVDETGAIQTEEFDLVVLSVGLTPHPASKELAQTADIAINRWGFAESRLLNWWKPAGRASSPAAPSNPPRTSLTAWRRPPLRPRRRRACWPRAGAPW